MAAMAFAEVQPGWDVFDNSGEDIGDVAEVGPNWMRVEQGKIFKKVLYIPFSAITSTEGRGIWLNVAKNDVNNMGWDSPPTAGAGASGAGDGGATT